MLNCDSVASCGAHCLLSTVVYLEILLSSSKGRERDLHDAVVKEAADQSHNDRQQAAVTSCFLRVKVIFHSGAEIVRIVVKQQQSV